jgi:hypothetical protein
VGLNAMLTSIPVSRDAGRCADDHGDPKRLELGMYEDIPT